MVARMGRGQAPAGTSYSEARAGRHTYAGTLRTAMRCWATGLAGYPAPVPPKAGEHCFGPRYAPAAARGPFLFKGTISLAGAAAVPVRALPVPARTLAHARRRRMKRPT